MVRRYAGPNRTQDSLQRVWTSMGETGENEQRRGGRDGEEFGLRGLGRGEEDLYNSVALSHGHDFFLGLLSVEVMGL